MSISPFETVPAAGGAAAPGSGNKKVLVAGGLAAAVALAGAGYFLLLAPGSDEVDTSLGRPASPVVKRITPQVKPAAKAVKPVAKPPAQVPPTSTAPLGRDPFRALYVLQPVAAPPAASAPVTPTTPTGSGGTSTGGTTTGGTSSGSGSTAPKYYAMTLKKVYGSASQRTAEFVVGGKTMLAKVGSVFGPTSELKLLSVGQNAKGVWVATIQVGDSEPFDAIQHQTVYVR